MKLSREVQGIPATFHSLEENAAQYKKIIDSKTNKVRQGDFSYSVLNDEILKHDEIAVKGLWRNDGVAEFLPMPVTGPVVVLLLAGCDLGSRLDCPGCTVDFEVKTSRIANVSEIDSLIFDLGGRDKATLLISGGEPALQLHIERIIDWRTRRGWKVIVETNGNLWRDVSPRLPSMARESKETQPYMQGATIMWSPKLVEGELYTPHPDLIERAEYVLLPVGQPPYDFPPAWYLSVPPERRYFYDIGSGFDQNKLQQYAAFYEGRVYDNNQRKYERPA